MNEHVSKILQYPHRDKVLIGLGSFLLGAGSGYILGFKRARGYTEDEVDRIDAAVRHVASEYTGADLPDEIIRQPLVLDADVYEEVAAKGAEFVKTFADDDEVEVDIPLIAVEDDEPEVIMSNVFAGNDDDWDHDAEVASRSETKPYILHKDEFFAEEKGYAQLTITYYAGDNMMADDKDEPVYNYEAVTGPLKFGHGSGDTKVVYVRNDKNRAEYEIVRHEGTFAEEVMGFEIEQAAQTQDLKHERSPGKFRSD